MAMITLSEYARRNEKDYRSVHRKYKNGDFKTAEKLGNVVMIDENEPYCDKRLINGRYIDYRKNIRIGRESQAQKFSEVEKSESQG